jgi:predicted AlkP superfamily phosphohydrolase/phosphomutase
LDPGRIYIHSRDRFARGPLAPAQAAALREELAEGLAGLAYEGEPVMERVFRREELYHGPFAHLGPDLVCLARPGFDLKAKFDRSGVFGRFHRHGCHAAHGVLYYDSQGTRPARVRDIGQEVLNFFGNHHGNTF